MRVLLDGRWITSIRLARGTWKRARIVAKVYGYPDGALALFIQDVLELVLRPEVWGRAFGPPQRLTPQQRRNVPEGWRRIPTKAVKK